jgi:hypothetical protein
VDGFCEESALLDRVAAPGSHLRRRRMVTQALRWDEHQREGAILVPAGCTLLIIEGVGAARRESAHLTDAAIWVQSDEREIERRSRARVGKPGNAPTVGAWQAWMAEEMPFVADQRPWERADIVICGTPGIPLDPGTQLAVAV